MAETDLQDAATRIGILSQRTTNLEGAVASVNASIVAMSSKVDERFNSLAASIADQRRPQWQAISVILVFVGMVGALAYWPIREATGDLKSAIQTVAERMVTREELDWRAGRATEDRAKNADAFKELRDMIRPRSEIESERRALDQHFADIQRQIDHLNQPPIR